MKVFNNTHYFNENSKVYNIVPDTNSFRYQSSKRMGYFQRLHFEFEYTKLVDGTAFFYTFTYNDKSIPKFEFFHYGRYENVVHHCFDYNHIRYITNGKLSKVLYRKFGSRLKYFCACESGDGKGIRGLGHNPHYHFIFYIQPIHKDGKPILTAEYDDNGKLLHEPYKKINCFDFRKLCKELWLGTNDFIRYQDAKFGIVEPGKFYGQIQGTDAFSYVGKYVIKSQQERVFESDLAFHYESKVRQEGYTAQVLIDYYKYLTEYLKLSLSFHDYVHSLNIPEYRQYKKSHPNHSYYNYFHFTRRYELVKCLSDLNDWFNNHYVPWYVSVGVNYYRRMYSGKPRMSKSLGEYGLNFISDIDSNPRITIPLHGEYKVQFPCLYYIRKLYYEVHTCPVTGNPIYTLSELGKTLKLNQLSRSINNYIFNVQQNVSYVIKNNVELCSESEFYSFPEADYVDLYNEFRPKVIIESKPYELPIMNRQLSVLLKLPDISRIYLSYAIYKCVYEFRNFKKGFMISVDDNLSMEDVKRDYLYLISQDKLSFNFSLSNVFRLVEDASSSLYSVNMLEPFSKYLEWFKLLDLVNDTCESIHSENKKVLFEERAESVKKINGMIYSPIVSSVAT